NQASRVRFRQLGFIAEFPLAVREVLCLDHSEIVSLLLALGVVLGVARLLGELARALNQPAVMGELFAGIVLGPTILGAIAPGLFATIFPSTQGFAIAFQGLTVLAITLFLLVAGIEVDLSS